MFHTTSHVGCARVRGGSLYVLEVGRGRALTGFVGGAGVAAVYARGIRRAKRQEEVANIREKDVRIEDWRVVLMARARRKILSATCLQLKVHACVRQELRSIAERRFDLQQEPRRRRLLTVAMRKWLVGFTSAESFSASVNTYANVCPHTCVGMTVSTLVSECQVQEILEIMHESVAKKTRRDPILEIMHESVANTTRRDPEKRVLALGCCPG